MKLIIAGILLTCIVLKLCDGMLQSTGWTNDAERKSALAYAFLKAVNDSSKPPKK